MKVAAIALYLMISIGTSVPLYQDMREFKPEVNESIHCLVAVGLGLFWPMFLGAKLTDTP